MEGGMISPTTEQLGVAVTPAVALAIGVRAQFPLTL